MPESPQPPENQLDPKKDEPKPSQKIIQTSKDSSKQTNTNNQPFQTNNNNGDVKNEPVAGDKVKGDKVKGDKIGGDKVMRDKVDRSTHVDNRTTAPVNRSDTTIVINPTIPKPIPLKITDEDRRRLSQIPRSENLVVESETSDEALSFAAEIQNYLTSKGYQVGEFDRTFQVIVIGDKLNPRLDIYGNKITILNQHN